jgi:hypothetical protein
MTLVLSADSLKNIKKMIRAALFWQLVDIIEFLTREKSFFHHGDPRRAFYINTLCGTLWISVVKNTVIADRRSLILDKL